MDLALTDKVLLVTGGTSGIGSAVVSALLAEGARVATCGRDEGRLAAAEQALDEQARDRFFGRRADVTDPDQVRDLVEATVERFGRLDGLVNNAGQSRLSTFASTDDEAWADELRLKFGSVVWTVRAARRYLAAAGNGAVVNVNAVLSRQPEAGLVATSAARAGVLNLSRSLATELGAEGIRVNSVLIGVVDSGQWRRRFEAAAVDFTYEEWSAALARDRGVVLGRFGRPEEVAAMITILLSPRAGYVTGTAIEIDGGVHRYA